MVEMHDLRDQSAADDADAHSSLSQTARDYTPTIDVRSIPSPIARPLDLTGSIAVASAPVSFGAFEVTVGIDPHVPDAIRVLDAVQQDGYEGIDLGPIGYLGSKSELAERLGGAGFISPAVTSRCRFRILPAWTPASPNSRRCSTSSIR
jgi:hypothetical protein